MTGNLCASSVSCHRAPPQVKVGGVQAATARDHQGWREESWERGLSCGGRVGIGVHAYSLW